MATRSFCFFIFLVTALACARCFDEIGDRSVEFSQRVMAELEEHVARSYHLQSRQRRQAKTTACHVGTVVVKLNELEAYHNKLPVPSELKVPYCVGGCIPAFVHDQRSQIIIRLAAGNGLGCVPNTETTPPPANETIFSFDSQSGTFDKVVIPNFYIQACKCIG